MPPLRTGFPSFGLVSIPVTLHTATTSEHVSFNFLHAKCGSRAEEGDNDPKKTGKMFLLVAIFSSLLGCSTAVGGARGGSASSGAPCPVVVTGDVLKYFDFEDGIIPFSTAWSAFKADVPASIHIDPDGNKFFRITATPADGGSGGFKDRVRSQASVGGSSAKEGETMTYNFSMRLGDDAPVESVVWQLFQYGTVPNRGYAAKDDGTGPTVWLIKKKDGSLVVGNYYNGENDYQSLNLGPIATNRFVDVAVTVHWSLEPSKGRIDVWLDGKLAGTLSGAPTILSSVSKSAVEQHVGTYGGNNYVAVGSVDFDNITVSKGTVYSSASVPYLGYCSNSPISD